MARRLSEGRELLDSRELSGGTMTTPKELEIKLALAPADLARLDTLPLIKSLKRKPSRATEVSVYFDTRKHKLRRKRVTLRVRREGERYIQTIKATGDAGPFERDEWETELAD